MVLKKLIFSYVLFLSLNYIYGQEPVVKFSHLTVNDGLSQSWIHAIYQDHLGFMWFGTDDGLNRYDGYEIVQYKYNSRDTSSINNNTILCINGDSAGNLWIGTHKGLNFYNRGKNFFYQDPEWSHSSVSSIKTDNLNNLWVCTRGKLFKYNPSDKKFIKFEPLETIDKKLTRQGQNLGNVHILNLCFDRKNNMWLGTNKGLCLFNPKTNTLIDYFQMDENPKNFGKYNITSIFEDHEGRLWIGHSGGLILLKNASEKTKEGDFIHFNNQATNPQSIAMGDVLTISEDINNNLLVGVLNGGLNILNLKEFSKGQIIFQHYKHDPLISSSLSNNSIYSIYKDRQQNIWVGTFGKGINMYSPFSNNFKLFRNDPLNKNTLNNSQVFSFLDDDNFVWLGTGGAGLDRYDKRNNSFTFFPNDPTNKSNKEIGGVWAMLKDKTGDIWLGTWAEGFKRFNPRTGKFIRYTYNPSDSNSISSNNVFAICESRDGNLWLGTIGGGLNMYNRSTNKFKRYNARNTPGMGYYIESIAEDKNGELWIAFEESLVRFDPKTRKVRNYRQDPKNNESLSGVKVYMVFCDSRSNLWLGTDVGLNLYQPGTDNFKSYQIQDGLPDNAIKSIAEDKFGNLWLGTNRGLSKFIGAINLPNTPKFKNYTQEDGLQSNEFSKRACLTSSDGTLYFGGENGFNVFNPAEIKENPNVPNIVFSDFLLFNKPVDVGKKGSPLTYHICQTKSITLNHQQSVFTIKFVAINYFISAKNQYAYIMEGYEPNWNYVGKKHEATYTSLPPGTYTFRVKASNNDGLWNEKGTSITIIVLPPWWGTLWFRFLFLLLIGIGLLLLYYLKVASYRAREKELTFMVRQRTHDLERTNELLLERQIQIEEQTNELMAQTESLKESNDLLVEKQKYIQKQTQVLEETNHKLSTLNTTKDKFFSIIAHDLRNPFHTVMGFSELLITKFDKIPVEKVKKYIQLIHTSSSNGNSLLENLLHWSRTQTGTISYEPEVIDLVDIARKTCNLLQSNAQRKNINLKNNIDSNTFVFADTNMVLTIFRNLISNAIKFTKDEGYISIYSTAKGSNIEITIEDNGIGIASEKQHLLFSINSGFSTPGTNQEQGTGLGLILCKEFIEMHKGKIWVESVLNEGSKFKFTLPINSI